ncbi:hypothetical protein [uncultured Shewanella sp.]|nr:hypothetical protein [uncultured Shewanella sp.]
MIIIIITLKQLALGRLTLSLNGLSLWRPNREQTSERKEVRADK